MSLPINLPNTDISRPFFPEDLQTIILAETLPQPIVISKQKNTISCTFFSH